MSEALRQLPSVHRVLDDPRLVELPRDLCRDLAREAIDEVRAGLLVGTEQAVPDVVERVARRARALLAGRHQAVINATGVVLHTNLGRAPWPRSAVDAAARAARYGNVEIDLASGRRGERLDGVRALLQRLTGAEDAVVVNNGAAAVLLALTAHARGREVLVSRGELVEIGGSFRVPDVIASGGARLVDVGTTNRTRIGDFRRAVTQDTAVLLSVHASNFRILGFTEAPRMEELVALGRERDLRVVHDLGSGALDGFGDEPSVRASVEAGVDLAIFSGDKLLGGPQAGIVVGRREAVAAMRRHPLYRALRLDKTVIAALEATLADHLAGVPTPAWAALHAPLDLLQQRAERLAVALNARDLPARVVATVAKAGGGSLPGEGIESRGVAVAVDAPDALHGRLRRGARPVVARIVEDELLLDVRTLDEGEVDELPDLLATAWIKG